MVQPRTSFRLARATANRVLLPFLFVFFCLICIEARAALQFDVFLGYEGLVPEASWFPAVIEVKNDGPSFTGVIEVSSGSFNASQTRRVVVELPTGTLKRLVIPVFSTARYQSSWDFRLLDERGRTRGEQQGMRPRKQLASGTLIVAALPRTPTGIPVLRTTQAAEAELQPSTARLQSSLVPDNPLVFEGMNALYLNTEKATELSEQQVAALLAWLNLGGHLILGIEQITDVNATPWLRSLVPCDLTDMKTVSSHPELQQWLRGSSAAFAAPRNQAPGQTRNAGFNPYSDVAEDPAFEKTDLQVVTGAMRGGNILVSSDGTPLIVTSHEGRGRVTCLMFSPERKPFSVWNNISSFWSKLVDVPPELYLNNNNNNNYNNMRGGWSIDGVFGAMIDSRQVRKLPVEWLLLLLIVYLVVIGPLDQYWLKSIKKPMLTWLTFPCYVVLFSLLIYFIGYKLRAGETEWNELHLVDVLAKGSGAELHGRTYASIYSPINATYHIEAHEHFSTFRGEFQSSWIGGGNENEEAKVLQTPDDNFKAEISVPVWTSQLYVSDWWQSDADLPLKISVKPNGSDWTLVVSNLRDHELTNARFAIGGRIIEVGAIAAGQTKTIEVASGQGMMLRDFVSAQAANFQNASQSRQHAFGSNGGQISNLPDSTMAVSFLSSSPGERFIEPPGLDMSSLLDQGNAVLLAWEANYSPIKPLNQFSTRRGQRNTLWRITVPINAGFTP